MYEYRENCVAQRGLQSQGTWRRVTSTEMLRSGEPGRTRTSNPLLKRQLLYH